MKKINVTGLKANAPMPQMLRERAEILREYNKQHGRTGARCYNVDFPVAGGWGYTQEDACVFDFGDEYAEFPPATRRSMMESDSISLENLFIERRVYEEIIYAPISGTPDLHCLKIKKMGQSLINGENGHTYEKIDYQVSGFLLEDFKFLCAEYERCKAMNDMEGLRRHQEMVNKRIVVYDTVCWFDISCNCGME